VTDLVSDIFYSRAKAKIEFNGKTIRDALNFGFSYIESEDHVVEYIVVNAKVMKEIFIEIPDSVIRPNDLSIGELWTAKLLLSDKLSDSQILFSNNSFSAVINLNLNPNNTEEVSGGHV
jgi:hypothetical protein